jgi:hypothetical protein
MRNSRRGRQTKRRIRNQNPIKYVAGDVTRNLTLEKILSIGYEFETSSLAKLTGIVEDDKLVGFLNTDTAREDISILTTVRDDPEYFARQAETMGMAIEDKIVLDNYEKQKKIAEMIKSFQMNSDSYKKRKNEAEVLRLKAYSEFKKDKEFPEENVFSFTSNNISETKKDKEFPEEDVSFFATNDISESPLVKHLNLICQDELLRTHSYDVDKAIDESGLRKYRQRITKIISEGGNYVFKNLEELFKYDESPNEEYKANVDKFYELIAEIYKQQDTYYKYKRIDINPNPVYDIQFEMWQNATCGTFADVEWVITYYKPTASNNIILETFINAIENLMKHLEKYTGEMHGNLTLSLENPDTGIINTSIVGHPAMRKIFYNKERAEEENQIYYLQTHLRSDPSLNFTLDDCSVTPQMTFSTLIEDVFDVMKYLAQDSINNGNDNAKNVHRYNVLENVENCVNELVNKYNESETAYLLLPDNKNAKIRELKRQLIKEIKNYIGLILLKLYVYINEYLTIDPADRTYLKDSLSFNSRHKNYELYNATKEAIRELFQGEELSNDTIAEIIQHLVIDEEILTEYLLDKGSVLEHAYSIDKVVDLDNDKGEEYGDPTASMLSYFQFFENPARENNIADEDGELVDEDEEGEEDNNKFKYHDWLEYSKVDIFSTQMDIQKHNGRRNKILIEFRGFSSMLMPYEIDMANGDTTILVGKTRPINTLGSFKRLISLYNDGAAYPEKGVVKSNMGGKKKTKRRRKNKTRPSTKN